MRSKSGLLALIVPLLIALPASAETEVESFDAQGFTNPFFMHEFEFDQEGVSWDIVNLPVNDSWALWLGANTDLITFDLAPGETISEVRITILDFEGGFVGNQPSSAIIVRAVSGDFVALHASSIGVAETVTASIETLGQLKGTPLGEIESIMFQVANEGNSEIPNIVGAFFDDITAVTEGGSSIPGDVDGDGDVDPTDLALLLASWGPYAPCPPFNPADIDQDCVVGAADLAQLLANWGA